MLAREKILAKLGPELTADLYVNRSWHDRPPTVMREDLNDQENQGDTNDEDDDEDDDGPDNSVTQRRNTGARVLGPACSGSGEWIERLGGFRSAHDHRKAAALG